MDMWRRLRQSRKPRYGSWQLLFSGFHELDNGGDGESTEIIDVDLMRRLPSALYYLFCIPFFYLIGGTLCGQHTGFCYQESLLDPVHIAIAIEDCDKWVRRFADD